jgi:hypothetical protein
MTDRLEHGQQTQPSDQELAAAHGIMLSSYDIPLYLQPGHPAGPSGIRAGDMGKAIAERLTFALSVLASPSPSCQAHPQRDRRPLGRQVLQMANLPAVTPGGSDITCGTPSSPRPTAETVQRPSGHSEPRSWRPDASAHLAFFITPHRPVSIPAVKPDPAGWTLIDGTPA